MVTSKTFAERITVILDYLKTQKISQYEVEERLNYTSLSKAKNYDKYPQAVIERKTREELFNLLIAEYGLYYDEVNESLTQIGEEKHVQRGENVLYYVMYYYAFARAKVGKAMVRIINNKHVIMDYEFEEHWEGTYEVIENYSFLTMEKTGGVTPVKKLICLFSGTKKTGRPILLGTYSTIKRDGFPAAGKILFERVFNKKTMEKKIKSEIDHRISFYLMNKVLVAETFTPNTLDDLQHGYKIISKFAGKYYLFYPRSDLEVVKIEMECRDDSGVLLYFNNITYPGSIIPVDNHTLKIEVSDEDRFSESIGNRIIIFLNTSKSEFYPFIYCVGISNAIESECNSFSCLAIKQDFYRQADKRKMEHIIQKIQKLNSKIELNSFS